LINWRLAEFNSIKNNRNWIWKATNGHLILLFACLFFEKDIAVNNKSLFLTKEYI